MFFYVPIAAPQRQGVDELETMCIRTHIDLAYAATVCRMPVCAKSAQSGDVVTCMPFMLLDGAWASYE